MDDPCDDWGPVEKQKPIDRWLALFALAVGVALYLLPKSPPVIIACLLVMFASLIHPAWNFWWIEKATWRRIGACVILTIILGNIGYSSWPKVQTDVLSREEMLRNRYIPKPPPFAYYFTPKRFAPKVSVVRYQPFPYEESKPAKLHVFIRPNGNFKIYGGMFSAVGNSVPEDYEAKKAFEERAWHDAVIDKLGVISRNRMIDVFQSLDTQWLEVLSDPLSSETIKALSTGSTLYFMGVIFSADGKRLAEYCVHEGKDTTTVQFCIDHNR